MERSKRVKADLSRTEINKRFATDFKRSSRSKYTAKKGTLRRVSRKQRKDKNKARYLGREKNGLRKRKNAKGRQRNLELEKLSPTLKVPPCVSNASHLKTTFLNPLIFVEHSFSKLILTAYLAWTLDKLFHGIKDHFLHSCLMSFRVFYFFKAALILSGKL